MPTIKSFTNAIVQLSTVTLFFKLPNKLAVLFKFPNKLASSFDSQSETFDEWLNWANNGSVTVTRNWTINYELAAEMKPCD